MRLCTSSVGVTDTGLVRDHNEDCFGIEIPEEREILETMGALYLVADGMGGHLAGEVASAQARAVVFEEYYRPSNGTGALDAGLGGEIGARLKRAVRKANEAVYATAQSIARREGMGTTLVTAVVRGSEVYIANVGDSRAYLFRDGRLQQITTDHSFVQEQVEAGILTPEMARNHPQNNVITRALGHCPGVEIDTFEGELQPGDRVLLCSDGLTGPVRDEQIAVILQRYPIGQAAIFLIALANANGGTDNVTVVLIEAQQRPLDSEQPPAVVLSPMFQPGNSSGNRKRVKSETPEHPPLVFWGLPPRIWILGGVVLAVLLIAAIVGLVIF